MGILLFGGAVVSSWSSESLSVSLKNIGPFFKNFPEIGTEESQTENSCFIKIQLAGQ